MYSEELQINKMEHVQNFGSKLERKIGYSQASWEEEIY